MRTPHNLELLWLSGWCYWFQVPSSTAGSSSTVNRTDIPRFTEPTQVMYEPVGSVYTKRHVTTTLGGDKPLRVYRSGDRLLQQIASCLLENFVKIFVYTAEFCRRNKLHEFNLISFCVTRCGDKILLRRQRFSQKFSSTHEAICRCNLSPWRVAATCYLVCSSCLKYHTGLTITCPKSYKER